MAKKFGNKNTINNENVTDAGGRSVFTPSGPKAEQKKDPSRAIVNAINSGIGGVIKNIKNIKDIITPVNNVYNLLDTFNTSTSKWVKSFNPGFNIKQLSDDVHTYVNSVHSEFWNPTKNYLNDITVGLYTLLSIVYGNNKVKPDLSKVKVKTIKGDEKSTLSGLFTKYFPENLKFIEEQKKLLEGSKSSSDQSDEQSSQPTNHGGVIIDIDSNNSALSVLLNNNHTKLINKLESIKQSIQSNSRNVSKAITDNKPNIVDNKPKVGNIGSKQDTSSAKTDNVDTVALSKVDFNENPKVLKSKINIVLDIIDELRKVANDEKQSLFVSSAKRTKQLESTFKIYTDAIASIIGQMNKLDASTSNQRTVNNAVIGNGNDRDNYKSSSLNIISSIMDDLQRLDNDKKFNLTKAQGNLQKIKKILSSGVFQDILKQIDEVGGSTTRSNRFQNAIDAIFIVANYFSEDKIDDLKDSIENANEVIGTINDKPNMLTLYSLTKSITGFVNYMYDALSHKDLKDEIVMLENIEYIFHSYKQLASTLKMKDLFGLSLKVSFITDPEVGTNAMLKTFVESTVNLGDYLNNAEGQLDELNTGLRNLGNVLGSYKDALSAISLKSLLLMPIKAKLLTDNNELIKNLIENIPEIHNKDVQNFINNVDDLQYLTLAFENLNKSIKVKTMLKTMILGRFMAGAFSVIKDIYWHLFTIYSYNKNLNVDVSKVQEDIIDPISNLNVQGLSKTMKTFTKLIPFAILSKFGMKKTESFITSFSDLLDTLKGIPTKTLNQLDKKKGTLEQILNVTKAISSISKTASVMVITAIIGNIGFKMAKMMSKSMISLVSTINELDIEDLNDNIEKLKAVKQLTSTLRSIAIAGGVMAVFAIPAMVGFFAMIGTLKVLNILIKSANDLTKNQSNIETSMDNIKSLGKLVMAIGFTMFIGAIVGGLVIARFKEMMYFAVAFGVFTLAVLGSVNLASKGMSESIQHAKEISHLILTLGGLMLFGAIFGGLIGKLMPNILIFTFTLSTFIFSVITALNIALKIGGGIRHLQKAAKGILQIVIASSAIMIFGAMIVLLKPEIIVGALAFTVMLGAFLMATVFAIKWGADEMRHAGKDLAYVMAFEIVSAAVLMLPAYMLAQNPKMMISLGIWTVCLSGFILAISYGLKIMPKENEVLRGSLAMAAIGGFCLLFASALWVLGDLSRRGVDPAVLIPMVAGGAGVIYLIVKFAGSIGKHMMLILQGVAALAGVELLCAGLAGVIYIWAKVAAEFNQATGILEALGFAGKLIVVMGGICIGLGSIAPMVGLGEAAMAGIEVLCLGLVYIIHKFCEVAVEVSELQKLSFDAENISSLFSTIWEIYKNLLPFAVPIVGMLTMMAAGSVSALSFAISSIAKAVSEASSMHYTKYENGKKVGEFNLTSQDFKKAAENTKEVVSVLGNAILEIYDKNPAIFNTGTLLGDLIGTETKFQKVVRSVSDLGKCISVIARGVSQAANMHYTKYENGKKVGEFNLNGDDFKKAASNTSDVVTILGKTILKIYDQNPEIFNTGTLLGDLIGTETKFQKVVKSVTNLGNMISKISSGVKDLAAGVITKYDKNGKETKRMMRKTDFDNAQAWTKQIVTHMGKMIINTYNAHPEFFTSGSSLGDALGFNPKFKVIVDTISALGTLMSNIADGISAFANNKIAVYGKDGKIVTYKPIPNDTYGKAATTIQNIVTLLGSTLMNIYDTHPDWFKTSWYKAGVTTSDNRFTAVMETLGGMSKLIGDYAEVIQKFANGTISVYDRNGKEVGKVPIGKPVYTKAAQCVSDTISTLGTALMEVWDEHKDDIFDKKTFKPLMSNLEEMSKLIGTYSDEIKDYANMTIRIYDKNGKYKGLRHFEEGEFKKAADTIKEVIKTMAIAISDVYNGTDNSNKPLKSIFEAIDGKSGGNTWFDVIVRSTSRASGLIGSLAAGVKEYASMRVPTYNKAGDKVIGSRELIEDDFINAGANISAILTTLVTSIANVYDVPSNKKLFLNAKSWGSTEDNSNPFYVISEALKNASEMVMKSSQAVDSVLKLPNINKPNIYSKLRTSINTMITALTLSVKAAYEAGGSGKNNIFNNKDIFNKVSGCVTASSLTIMKAIQVYSLVSKFNMDNLNTMTGGKGVTDVKENLLYKMVNGLTTPIVELYNGDKDHTLFGQVMVNKTVDDFAHLDTIFNRIVGGVKAVSMVMDGVGNAYKSISEITAKFVNKIPEISTNIGTMIHGLMDPIVNILKSAGGEAFNDAWSAKSAVGEVFGGIARVAGAVMSLGITEIAGLFKKEDKTPDTPFMRVVNGLATASKVIFSATAAVIAVSKLTIPDNIQTTINKIFTSVLQPIIDISKQDIIDEADDALDDVKDVFLTISELFIGKSGVKSSGTTAESYKNAGILDIYYSIANLKIADRKTMNFIKEKVKTLVTALPEAFSSVVISKDLDMNNLVEVFKNIQSAAQSMTGTYNSVVLSFKTITDTTGTKDLSQLITQTNANLKLIVDGLSDPFAMHASEKSVFNLAVTTKSAQSTAQVMSAFNNLFNVYESIPTYSSDKDYFIPYLTKLNAEIGNVVHLNEFIKETDNLVKFNNSINSLQVQNVMTLTKLFETFNAFSSRFGNLDKFTQVLATKMAIVLEKLANEIRDSAKLINKTEAIQKKRQSDIQKSIDEFKKLAEMGLEVTVKQAEVETSSTPGGTGSTSDTTTQSTNEIQSQNVGSGSSAGNARNLDDIAQNVRLIRKHFNA